MVKTVFEIVKAFKTKSGSLHESEKAAREAEREENTQEFINAVIADKRIPRHYDELEVYKVASFLAYFWPVIKEHGEKYGIFE